MSNKIIPFPFSAAFSAYKQSRNQDTKKVLFKNFLETYVKLNMAIHLSWILKSRKQDIPANLRVQIVQLFQKPPSIGFCHSICKSVNPIMVGDMKEENTQLSYFAKFFDRNESSLSRLIEIRNAEAHGTIKFEKDIHDEIREHMQILIMQPLFTSACLIISGFEDMLKAGFDHPKGIEQSNYQFLLLKEEVFIEDEYSVLDGTELCLFPFAISNEKADICLWNQRSGKKGTYTSYLSENINKIEVTGITEFAGFPYEDWKRSANPIYVNYLTCRNKVQEELLDDEKIDIEEWHKEILYAFRLEKDLNLDKNEQIGYKSYVSGILQKLNKIEDEDIKLNYHRKIFDLKDNLDDFNVNDRRYLIQEIFKSITFLFRNSMNENKRDKFNYYYKEGLALIPFLYFLTSSIQPDILFEFCGGINNLKYFDNRKRWIKISFTILFLFNVFSFFYFNLFFSILLLISIITLIYKTFNYNNKRIKELFYIQDVSLKKNSIKYNLYNLIFLITSRNFGLALSIKETLENTQLNTELLKVFIYNSGVNHTNHDNKNFDLNQFGLEVFKNNISSSTKIVLTENMLANEILENKSLIVDDTIFKITPAEWKKLKSNEFDINSKIEKSYLQSKLNNIVYYNNLKSINLLSENINKALEYEDIHFWADTNNYKEEFTKHHYLKGWIWASIWTSTNAALDLELSAISFNRAAFEGSGILSYYALYNLAQVYGAWNRVSDYFLTYLTFNKRLEDEEDTVIEQLSSSMIKDVKMKIDEIKQNLPGITEEKFSEHSLKMANLVWHVDKEFRLYGTLKGMNDSVKTRLKYTHGKKMKKDSMKIKIKYDGNEEYNL